MATHCDNCGCRKVSGYCTNCHEEAYIMNVQATDHHFSDEFTARAWEQEKERANKGNGRIC